VEESAVIRRNMSEMDTSVIKRAVSGEELIEAFRSVESVRVSDEVVEYLARLAAATRADARVSLGASPRALVHLSHCARAKAYLFGRNYVIPDDIKELWAFVVSHRLRLNQRSMLLDGKVTIEEVTRDIVDGVEPPR
jgi:MoxR-like ATPase